LDCYRVGISPSDALEAIVGMQAAGELPPASAFVHSGRGLWALWLLRDIHNPEHGTVELFGVTHVQDTPQRASPRAIALYAKVQRALAEKLRSLGADLGAVDGSRFAPVPGTLKTGPGRRVVYSSQADHDGQPFLYNLVELATALGIPLSPPSEQPRVIREALPVEPARHSALSEGGRKGWLARWQRALGDFEILLTLRGGGFAEGVRNRGAFYYACFLTYAGMKSSDVTDRVRAYGAKCRPALSSAEIRGALKAAKRPKDKHTGYVRNTTWRTELGVTAVEASYLMTAQEPEPSPREQRRQARRGQILAVVEELGFVPSTRSMANRLSTSDHSVGHVTVQRDYHALGLSAERANAKHASSGLVAA
jgi:hypothetical protein